MLVDMGGGGVKLEVSGVDVSKNEPGPVFDREGITVSALTIPRGNIPAVAYRVQTLGVSLVFRSDQNGTNPRFVDFAGGANVLIMHLAIAAGTTNPLHAAPAVVGRIAQEAGVGRLILSHIGQFDLNAAVAEVKTTYAGALTVSAATSMNCGSPSALLRSTPSSTRQCRHSTEQMPTAPADRSVRNSSP